MENQQHIAGGAVIIKNGMTLLAKRKGSHGSGRWGSMGGHANFGETPRETAIREAREELGIEIGNLRFVSCESIVGPGKHYLDVSFLADIVSGEPQIMEPDKIEEIGWFPLDRLPEPLYQPVNNGVRS
jgi:8-oxo-dGTP diphosphatase